MFTYLLTSSVTHTETDRQTDRQTDRDRQTDEQTDRYSCLWHGSVLRRKREQSMGFSERTDGPVAHNYAHLG